MVDHENPLVTEKKWFSIDTYRHLYPTIVVIVIMVLFKGQLNIDLCFLS